MTEALILAMQNLEEEKVLRCVQELHAGGADNIAIINTLNIGMVRVGKLFETGSYYLADLIVSGTIYRQALDLIESRNHRPPGQTRGRILIGVVKNDIHDIGKDIIVGTLLAEGFDVIDLGVDVACEDFIQAVSEHKPDILALSGTMSYAIDEMERIIKVLDEKKARPGLAVIIGGGCANKHNALRIGADFYSKDPIEALTICKELLESC
ncbi:MAG: cobalamin-dependent protein [Treponema sp.]|nr:cobalamin-dependent protein [Treponema sp.]